jgi:hypothetical protein
LLPQLMLYSPENFQNLGEQKGLVF